MAVDVAGYSARSEADEDAAADEVAALARQISALCERHGGRVFNTAGDGFMLEFSTVSGALEAAEALAATSPPPVRVGVHLGEVRVGANGDLLGHGVNVAARIQALAEPRAVLVSADVKRQIRGPLAGRLKPMGMTRLDKMDETLELFVLSPDPAAPAPTLAPTRSARIGRRGLLATGAAAVTAAAAGGGYLAYRGLKPAPKADPLIAVLPFDSLSPDPQLGYFAEGLSEDILDALLRSGGLRVTARTSSFNFRGADKAKAGAALKADYLVDGSVLREGQRLRVNVRLDKVSGQQTLWSQSFDRDVGQQLQVEDEIAGQIAAALRVRFSSTARKPVDPVAYDLYLKGRAASRIHTPASVRQGHDMLQMAVQLAPDFPQAWFELANNDMRGGLLQPLAQQERTYLEGRQAAQRARTLDPAYGAAWAIDAILSPNYQRWAACMASLDRGTALSPHDADILLWRSYLLQSVGRLQAAVAPVREAWQLNMLDSFAHNVFVQALTYTQQFAEAEQAVDRVAILFPRSLGAYWYRFWLLVAARRFPEAAAWLGNDAAKPPGPPTDEYTVMRRAVIALQSGGPGAKVEAAKECVNLAGLGIGYAGNAMILVAGLGQLDMARDVALSLYLKTGPVKIDRSVQFVGDSRYQPFDEASTLMLFHPFLKPLRDSGVLKPVFDGVGLTDYWRSVPPDAGLIRS